MPNPELIEGKLYWWRPDSKSPWELAFCDTDINSKTRLKFFNGSRITSPVWGDYQLTEVKEPITNE